MRIAVIGWGSLIWCPGSLKLASWWHKSGPNLPIEFSRVSSDDRLTLVITPGANKVMTLWALSACNDLRDAADHLITREKTSSKYVGRIHSAEDLSNDNIVRDISVWLTAQALDGAVWTALPPQTPENWTESEMTPEGAVIYIRSLDDSARSLAERYIRNAPEQIETPIRKKLREEFGWENNPLPRMFFEE